MSPFDAGEFTRSVQAEVAKHDARVPEQRAGERFHCELDAHIAESMKDPEFAAAYDDATERHRIIDELLALRRERGITQKAVAERMGVGQPTISQFESEASDPRISTLMRYARAVGANLTGTIHYLPPAQDVGDNRGREAG